MGKIFSHCCQPCGSDDARWLCQKEAHHNNNLNIGYQKYGILPILKARGDLEKALKDQGVQVKWVEFPAGPQLLEGLNVGSVSLGEAGEAPPIFAQAANPNLVYVANQPAAQKQKRYWYKKILQSSLLKT